MDAVVAFVMSHLELVAGLVVAMLDFGFALNSKWAANGILHSIYLWIKSFAKPKV